MNIRGIIFDNWNTLVQAPNLMRTGSSTAFFHNSFKNNNFNVDFDRYIEEYGLVARKQMMEAEMYNWREMDYIGRLRSVLERLGVQEPTRGILARRAWSDYLTEWPRQTHFFPETLRVLNRLKGYYKLGVLTNFMDGPTARQIFKILEYEKYFQSLVVSAEVGYMKPSPIVFLRSMNELDLGANECVMVGDTYNTDIVGAHKVGIKGVLIDSDGTQKEHHNECEMVISNIGNFLETLKSL
jgi:putative hydrolase of the HAD superfamily